VRRWAVVGAVGCVACVLAWSASAGSDTGGPVPPTSAPGATYTLAASADARTEEANPAVNFGLATRLGSDGDVGSRVASFLSFDLSGVSGMVIGATLRLYAVSDGTINGPDVVPVGTDWTETGVTWSTRPQPTAPPVAHVGAVVPGTWVDVNVTSLVTGNGPVGIGLQQKGTDGVVFYSRQGVYKPQLVITTGDPVVIAAGDIACKPGSAVTADRCRQAATADLITRAPAVTRVLALGDQQYEDGALTDYTGPGGYDATWGTAKLITAPVPGNHDYHTPGASGYFDYFGAAAGDRSRGYYAYDLGAWHLVALNSEISTATGSSQEQWLRRDLAATTRPCVLAYWHEPRFSSGYHGAALWVSPLWDDLYAAGADLVLNGHDHDYERFAPQDPSGQPNSRGVREFVVGTGGAQHEPLGGVQSNSEVLDGTTFGVLQLTLRARGYDWSFVPEAGRSFTDTGSASCHDEPPRPSLAVSPSSGAAPLAATLDASASTDADRTAVESYRFDFGEGAGWSAPQPGPTVAHVYAAPGTYDVRVQVTDRAGLSDTAGARVKVGGNLVGNPGFEPDTRGWNASGSGPGIELQSATPGHTGEHAAALVNSGTVASTCTLNDSPNWVARTSAGGYTAGLWARADTPGASLRLRFREWNGSLLAGTATTWLSLSADWQPVTLNYTPVAPGLSTLDLNATVVGAAPGVCFYADDVSMTGP
jgi:hypothetical protein